MPYKTFNNHAPTGATGNARLSVTPNPYAPEGLVIGYPTKFDLYVTHITEVDGSQQVTREPHYPSELQGSRLYLHHRPLVDTTGGITDITVTDGTIIKANTDAVQAYIEFSVDPTGGPDSPFHVTYTAAPDCFNHEQFNRVKESVMELERQMGPNNQTGWIGFRNSAVATFDKPSNAWDTLLQNFYSLPHLKADIRISSTDDNTLSGSLGDRRVIQIGRVRDQVVLEGTGIIIGGVKDASITGSIIQLGTQTGDKIKYSGTFSGDDQMTIGSPQAEVARHSGKQFSSLLSGWFYSGAMLRVHGDIACMGSMDILGPVNVLHSTGETSSINGDLLVRDELTVNGQTHLQGPTDTNAIHCRRHITLDGNLYVNNTKGVGVRGHSLIDNLDCSEIEHTYKPVNRKAFDNYIIQAPKSTSYYAPRYYVYGTDYVVSGGNVPGDTFLLTGIFTQAASDSGAHFSVLQLNFEGNPLPMVSGFYHTTGTPAKPSGYDDGGIFSRGLFDPGSLWVRVLNGLAAGYEAPIYGHKVEQYSGDYVTKINAFTPAQPDQAIANADKFMLFSPGCEYYDFIQGGATATDIKISASAADPLWIAFKDEVRVLESTTIDYSINDALNRSTSGVAGTNTTGTAFIFASKKGIDIEAAPAIVVRPTPFSMPDETLLGEVTATGLSSTSWEIKERTSYRPGGKYDSAWIPVATYEGVTSGRTMAKISDQTGMFYFSHSLGADVTFADVTADIYLGSYGDRWSRSENPNHHRAFFHSLWGADNRHQSKLSGAFTKIPLSNLTGSKARDTSVIYMDGKTIGIQFQPAVMHGTRSGVVGFDYMRLIMTRNR